MKEKILPKNEHKNENGFPLFISYIIILHVKYVYKTQEGTGEIFDVNRNQKIFVRVIQHT